MAASFTKLRPVAEIPTLSQLYRSGKLTPAVQEDLPNASQKLNDTICHIQHSITRLQVDAIVNAANEYLLGGGGIDGAIHRAAGPGLLKECRTLHGCEAGSAKITGAYELPCKKVIHAVGPIFRSFDESEPLLRSCYRKSLELAVDNDCKSIALCGISTGIYGYPPTAAAEVALHEVRDFLTHTEKGTRLEKVIFCSYNNQDVASYVPNIPIHPRRPSNLKNNMKQARSFQHGRKERLTTDNFPNSDNLKIPTMYNTNTHRGLEVDIRGEVAENADEPNTETHNIDFQMEGTEERLARLRFRSAGLDCDITTTFNRLAIAMDGNQERMKEQD